LNFCFQIFQTFLVLDQISRGQTPISPLCGRPLLQIHLCFFSNSIKMRGLPLSPASHCLAALPATMSTFNIAVLPQASLQNESIHKKIH